MTNQLNGPATDERSSGHGLIGMAERTTVAGGTFCAGRDGGQWVVSAHVPGSPS